MPTDTANRAGVRPDRLDLVECYAATALVPKWHRSRQRGKHRRQQTGIPCVLRRNCAQCRPITVDAGRLQSKPSDDVFRLDNIPDLVF